MKVSKLYTGILLASTLIVTGCGSDDSDSTIITDNNTGPIVNNELNYTAFDSFTDVSNGLYKKGWGKITFKINNNGLTRTTSTVVGSSDNAYQISIGDEEGHHDYYVADKTFAKVKDGFDNSFYKVNFIDSDSFNLKIQTDNRSIDAVYDIKTLDLSGVKKLAVNAKTGINTDLSYDGFQSNVAFPTGSQCYILQETPSQSYYTFYDLASREDITINQWLDEQRKYNTVTNIINEKVGRNNELTAVRYTDENGEIEAAVQYNGLVYNAYYYQKDVQEDSDTDFTKGVVDCDLYNSVATKFLETQIKTNYKW